MSKGLLSVESTTHDSQRGDRFLLDGRLNPTGQYPSGQNPSRKPSECDAFQRNDIATFRAFVPLAPGYAALLLKHGACRKSLIRDKMIIVPSGWKKVCVGGSIPPLATGKTRACASTGRQAFFVGVSRELRDLFVRKRYQGVAPDKATFLFVGLDANHMFADAWTPARGAQSNAGKRKTVHANVRTDFSRSHWRVLAAAMNASLSLASTMPTSMATFAISKSALPPLSTAIALR